MIIKKSRKTSSVHNWQVTFNGIPESLEWSAALSEQPSGRILDVKDLNVHPGDSVQITSGGCGGGKDFVAQWNLLLSTAAITDQNPGSKPSALGWLDIGWLTLNLDKTRKQPAVKFRFQERGITYLQLKYSGHPAGTQMLMSMPEKQKPNKIPSKEMVIRLTIDVS